MYFWVHLSGALASLSIITILLNGEYLINEATLEEGLGLPRVQRPLSNCQATDRHGGRPLFWGIFSLMGGVCAIFHGFCNCVTRQVERFEGGPGCR